MKNLCSIFGLIFIFVVVGALLSCGTCRDSKKSKTIQTRYEVQAMHYEMSQEQVGNLKRTLELLSFGDDEIKIIEMLGKPNIYREISGKKLDSPITGYILTYYTAIYEKNTVNEIFDRYVTLVLDANHKLTSIRYNFECTQENK